MFIKRSTIWKGKTKVILNSGLGDWNYTAAHSTMSDLLRAYSLIWLFFYLYIYIFLKHTELGRSRWQLLAAGVSQYPSLSVRSLFFHYSFLCLSVRGVSRSALIFWEPCVSVCVYVSVHASARLCVSAREVNCLRERVVEWIISKWGLSKCLSSVRPISHTASSCCEFQNDERSSGWNLGWGESERKMGIERWGNEGGRAWESFLLKLSLAQCPKPSVAALIPARPLAS